MKRLLVLVGLVALVSGVFASAAHTDTGTTVARTLHQGDHGKRVAAFQWLMSGQPPSVYRGVRTYRAKITGRYDRATAVAVWNMKWRLGYPRHQINKQAGRLLFDLLTGRAQRPLDYVARAAKRLNRVRVPVKATPCTDRIVATASREVGVHEVPWHSNSGARVSEYQAVTGAYHAAWCASFAQWVLVHSGYRTIANRSAGVFYIRDWSQRAGLLRAIPKPGALVLFIWQAGHMGVVVSVTSHGFFSVEGNEGDAVRRVYHSLRSIPVAFVYLPNCS